ncbi:ATP phosphoribosyltransferase regulatory subunit [Chloroflexota bacterium]
MKVPRCKGTRDLMPQDMARFRQVEGIFRECCQAWGYQEIRTPTLEYLHLFTSVGTLTPDMLSRVYSFLDWDGWSGERVVLRPDGTIPAARLYVENLQYLSGAKLFYVENVFAFDSTGKEPRERWQCGVELIGGNTIEGDVELIMLALEAIAKLGIEPVDIRLSHAGLIKTLLDGVGLSVEQHASILDQVFAGNLDVLDGIEGRTPELEKSLKILFGLRGDTPGFVENLRGAFLPSFPELEPSLDNLGAVACLLTDLGCSYQIDFTSGRGFEYYTGTIFGFYSADRRLGRGGRYDELIPLVGGKGISASGFALYIDEFMSLGRELLVRDRILVRGKDPEVKSCFEACRLLREAGHVAELHLGCQKAADFRWIVDIDGEDELGLTDQISGKKKHKLSFAMLVETIEEAGCR